MRRLQKAKRISGVARVADTTHAKSHPSAVWAPDVATCERRARGLVSFCVATERTKVHKQLGHGSWDRKGPLIRRLGWYHAFRLESKKTGAVVLQNVYAVIEVSRLS